jgi:hypothetical protein
MNSNLHEYLKVWGDVEKAIDVDSQFPSYVFRGAWNNFYLFDSGWIFEGVFMGKIFSLLDAEGSSCAYLANLDQEMGDASRVFFISRGTTAAAYQSQLCGTGPTDGWIYVMDRFACISDKGMWCIYCERRNELAVIGFRQGVSLERYKSALESVHAGRAADVLAGCADYELLPHVISQEWRDEIFRLYGF